MHQIVCRLGLCPRPHWGSLQRSPDLLAIFRGLLLREGREEEGRDKAEEGTGRRGGPEREGEGRKGEGPHDPLAWGPQCLNPALTQTVTVTDVLVYELLM